VKVTRQQYRITETQGESLAVHGGGESDNTATTAGINPLDSVLTGKHNAGCHRTVGMVFRYRLRGLLLLLLNSSNNFYHSDTGFREATEVCESFYDTLLTCKTRVRAPHALLSGRVA